MRPLAWPQALLRLLFVPVAVAIAYAQPAPAFRIEETTIAQIQAALRARTLTCRALVEQYLKRIDAYDKKGPALNAIVLVHPDAGIADVILNAAVPLTWSMPLTVVRGTVKSISDTSLTIGSTEMVLARAPEVIVELRYSASTAAASDQRAWDALGSVPAVKNHRVYLLTGESEFVARMDARSPVKAGQQLDVLLDLSHMHTFDRQTQEAIV